MFLQTTLVINTHTHMNSTMKVNWKIGGGFRFTPGETYCQIGVVHHDRGQKKKCLDKSHKPRSYEKETINTNKLNDEGHHKQTSMINSYWYHSKPSCKVIMISTC